MTFEHPNDGFYMIEPFGEHANGDLVQVIDKKAGESIVSTFNRQAADPKFAGMLIDHEHFRHQMDKETIAYGWLTELQNREDGIYGKIRWTGTGQKAVDNGDYRFFSTEYDRGDLESLSANRVRPIKLDGLTLTNSPNNKGAPITNRNGGERKSDPQAEAAGILNRAKELQAAGMSWDYAFATASSGKADNLGVTILNRARELERKHGMNFDNAFAQATRECR